MNEDVAFIRKHRGKGALLDANLLLVYVTGKFDKNRMSQFSRTQQYVEDFPLIEYLVELFPVVHTTPNVLTEVSNLAKDLGPQFYEVLKRVVKVWMSGTALARVQLMMHSSKNSD